MSKRKFIIIKIISQILKKFIAKNSLLKSPIEKALLKLEEDAFAPALKTHKLSGNLYGILCLLLRL